MNICRQAFGRCCDDVTLALLAIPSLTLLANPATSSSVAAKRFLQKTVLWTVFLLLRLLLLFPKSFTTFWVSVFVKCTPKVGQKCKTFGVHFKVEFSNFFSF